MNTIKNVHSPAAMTDSIEPLLALHIKFCELAGIDANDLRFLL